MNSEIIIKVEGLYKTYPGASQPAINGIDLVIQRGSFFGLLGPNGAGKTTLLSMLTGLLNPGSGKMQIAGLDIRDNLNEIKHRIGFVPQEIALYPALTSRENLVFFGAMQGLTGSYLYSRVEECLGIADLHNFADSRIETFSGGMKRRLSLVVGLIGKPEILFMDEPTVGIDPQSRHFIYNTLRKMNKQGMTIVYTSHYMEEVEQLCNDIAIIDHGSVIARGETTHLLSQYGHTSIEMRTSTEIPANLQKEISVLPSLRESYFTARGFTLKSDTPQQTLLKVVAMLQQNNISIISLCQGTVNLEQLFLSLTGTRLRE